MRIMLVMAMHAEAEPIIEQLNFKPSETDTQLSLKAFHTQHNEQSLHLLINGVDRKYQVDSVGTVPAALTTFWGIQAYQPELIINAGTAGAFEAKGAKIGDVYLSEDVFRYHDHRIPLPGFEDFGIGHYPCMDTTEIAEQLGLKRGRVSSGDSLDMLAEDKQQILDNQAILKEMEAAAIAYVAGLHGIPMLALKSVTDLLDHPVSTQEQFIENLHTASHALTEQVVRLLQYYSKI